MNSCVYDVAIQCNTTNTKESLDQYCPWYEG